MRAGDRRHRIILQSPITNKDSYGEPVVTWSTVGTVWAAVWPLSGKEFYTTNQRQAMVSHRIRILFRDDVKSTWRALWGSRVLAFDAVINLGGRNKELEIMANEVVT